MPYHLRRIPIPSALSIVFNNPSIRIGALAILFFGFSNAATAPYQAVIGIREIGLSNTVYSLLMLFAAIINVSASVLMGIVADRLGEYRKPMLLIALFGVSEQRVQLVAGIGAGRKEFDDALEQASLVGRGRQSVDEPGGPARVRV